MQYFRTFPGISGWLPTRTAPPPSSRVPSGWPAVSKPTRLKRPGNGQLPNCRPGWKAAAAPLPGAAPSSASSRPARTNSKPSPSLSIPSCHRAGQEVLWTSGALFPVLHEALDWPIMNEPVDFYGGQVALRMYAEVNSAVQPFVWGAGWSEAWDVLVHAQSQVLDGDMGPEDALADAAQEIRDLQGLG